MQTALYQNQQIRDLESLVIAQEWDDEYGLMQKAGAAALTELRTHWPDARSLTVCCGKGNNAGDGYVLAQLAHQQGMNVQIYHLAPSSELIGAAQLAAKACQEAGVSMNPYTSQVNLSADVIVDALLGSGLKGEVREPFATAIAAINATGRPVLAVDVPSGLNVDNGEALGCAVNASVTVTFIGLKPGLYTFQGPSHCGKIIRNDLNINEDFFKNTRNYAELLDWELIESFLPRRARNAHKGDFGHVLVVGGDYGMGGAVRMAAEAALRVGAGLVSVATRPEHVPVVSSSRPEIMCHEVMASDDVEALFERASVLVIGPGLGQTDWAKLLLNKSLESKLPLVVDADALNILSAEPRKCDHWIVTPHPGEAARMLEQTTEVVQHQRFEAAQELQLRYGGVAVLKGAGTIVRDGSELPRVCPAGNPGMATAGMGDVLSGVIGGLLAQGLSLTQAAQAGVMIHALAGDRAAAAGGERGLLACDLMPYIRELVNPDV